mmetsp:Transcript_87086/g.221806  ORF Transcript_87086/g.221806 Transcript_87086/m.221806 type:complete len:310 (+) Transcript_87086:183-1112(+)
MSSRRTSVTKFSFHTCDRTLQNHAGQRRDLGQRRVSLQARRQQQLQRVHATFSKRRQLEAEIRCGRVAESVQEVAPENRWRVRGCEELGDGLSHLDKRAIEISQPLLQSRSRQKRCAKNTVVINQLDERVASCRRTARDLWRPGFVAARSRPPLQAPAPEVAEQHEAQHGHRVGQQIRCRGFKLQSLVLPKSLLPIVLAEGLQLQPRQRKDHGRVACGSQPRRGPRRLRCRRRPCRRRGGHKTEGRHGWGGSGRADAALTPWHRAVPPRDLQRQREQPPQRAGGPLHVHGAAAPRRASSEQSCEGARGP